MPRLLSVKERVSQEASRYASIRVRQWLALSAVRAGQLRLAYEESQAALTLIEHMQGFALLKGYVEIALAQVCYQWNRLEEARELLRMVVHHAAAWQQLEQLAWGYAELIQVELARRDRPAAELALHEVEQLVQRERFGIYPGASGFTQGGCQRCKHSAGWRKDSSRQRPSGQRALSFQRGHGKAACMMLSRS